VKCGEEQVVAHGGLGLLKHVVAVYTALQSVCCSQADAPAWHFVSHADTSHDGLDSQMHWAVYSVSVCVQFTTAWNASAICTYCVADPMVLTLCVQETLTWYRL
jgi:hypothetical protein